MRDAVVELRGASVLRAPSFKQLCDAAAEWRGVGAEVDLGKARSGGSATNACTFWDLLDPSMRARVVAVGFGDYAAGLHRTQPRFPPAMRYALMERWNDCTHTFVFGFGEMTLTPMDYAAITGLHFTGPVPPLDVRYQTATLGAQLVRSLLGVTTQTRYTAQGCVSYEVVFRFWAERIRTRLAAWRELPVEARPAAPAYTREERDQTARGLSGDSPAECRRIPRYLAHCHHTYASGEDPKYWRSFLNDRELSDGLTREDLEVEYRGFSANDFLSVGDFPTYFSSRMQARLPEILEYTQRKTHKTVAHYRAEAAAEAGAAVALAGPTSVVLGDVAFPPGMEVVLDPGLGLGSGIIIPADLRQAPPPVQLDPEHTTHVPAHRYQELCQQFGFARSYIGRLYSKRHERDLEIGRLRRHQSRQSSAVSRLQAEVDRLRTRLEVEGIPLDSSDEDDDSSSDDAPPSPPPQAATGPSRRRR
ncbi:hypothetical protein JCGZ_10305 [Jatropha curcas]|uniref:Aminotransferase-like plant mobile domain-containing protein n=1 Tax=Jatropha curcas TaxID=180498 RepID=A0A067KM11_JATCU|nr:hypothetical protein JCGZ_10305 [Jatropha curcas]